MDWLKGEKGGCRCLNVALGAEKVKGSDLKKHLDWIGLDLVLASPPTLKDSAPFDCQPLPSTLTPATQPEASVRLRRTVTILEGQKQLLNGCSSWGLHRNAAQSTKPISQLKDAVLKCVKIQKWIIRGKEGRFAQASRLTKLSLFQC